MTIKKTPDAERLAAALDMMWHEESRARVCLEEAAAELRRLAALEAAAPIADAVGRCCYGGTKPKSACASCAAWTPAPQTATSERQPLTDEQVEDGRWNWLHGPASQHPSAFVAGARYAERAHGIGTQTKQEDGNG